MSVETEDLCRSFHVSRDKPSVDALKDVSFIAARGSTHGLLGPNGAGKTTLTRILATLLTPSSGHARVDGADVVAQPDIAKSRLGIVLGGERGLYGRLTAFENVRLWASLNGLSRSVARTRSLEALDSVRLDPAAWDRRTEGFSRGMLQRVHLARAIVTTPAVLLLDEPTSGLDPIAALEFRELVRTMSDRGATVLLTTHDLVEAEVLCDEVSVLHKGRMVATGTPADLRRMFGSGLIVEAVATAASHSATIARLADRYSTTVDWAGGTARLSCRDDHEAGSLVTALVADGLVQVTCRPPSLDEIYRRLLAPDHAVG